jgi:glutamine synthetase type III
VYQFGVRVHLSGVRTRIDAFKKIVSKEAWPFPGYDDLLFRL